MHIKERDLFQYMKYMDRVQGHKYLWPVPSPVFRGDGPGGEGQATAAQRDNHADRAGRHHGPRWPTPNI